MHLDLPSFFIKKSKNESDKNKFTTDKDKHFITYFCIQNANTEVLGHFIFWTMLSAKAEKLDNSFICGANFFIKKKCDHLY